MKHRRSVALLLETSNAYARGLLDGIVAYQREHDLWSIYVGEQQRGARPPEWLRDWKGDGIIARIETTSIARAVKRTKLPTVDVSAARRIREIPWVETNDRKIALLAANHLIERGFTTLAFCGEPGYNWSNWREQSFIEAAQEANCDYHVYHGKSYLESDFSYTQERRQLARWIRKLPKPIGVMACYDFKGQQVLDICRDMDIPVPGQVAVIGVDNDARLCNLCNPPLSSVIPDTHQTGYVAAQLLDRLMRKEKITEEATLIPPLGIAARQSSDIYAIDDEDIAAALRYIREHACEGITVANILKSVPLSRRALEHRFQKLVRRTPHEEIVRVRMERVCRLLRETDLSLSEIAMRSGFGRADYLSVAFKRFTGQSPRAFRKQNRHSIPTWKSE